MTVKVTGGAAIIAAMQGMKAEAVSKFQDACFISAETVRSKVVLDINTQKANPTAKPGRRGHIPAPAGGPPNADTGNLSSRYTTTNVAANNAVISRVIAGVKYALWLEYGTTRMGARPHLIPRFNEERPKFVKRIQSAATEMLNNAKKKGRST